jgi:HEPN domain-containing protein
LKDAQALLEKGCYSGAYYLAGYAVECGLKACIAKQTRKFDFPPEPATIREIYVHNIETLLKSAGVKRAFDEDVKKDKKLEVNRAVVTRWNERSRYEEHTETEARDLYDAVTDKRHGVLQWISQRW